jgi:hypothetical protein
MDAKAKQTQFEKEQRRRGGGGGGEPAASAHYSDWKLQRHGPKNSYGANESPKDARHQQQSLYSAELKAQIDENMQKGTHENHHSQPTAQYQSQQQEQPGPDHSNEQGWHGGGEVSLRSPSKRGTGLQDLLGTGGQQMHRRQQQSLYGAELKAQIDEKTKRDTLENNDHQRPEQQQQQLQHQQQQDQPHVDRLNEHGWHGGDDVTLHSPSKRGAGLHDLLGTGNQQVRST